MSLNRRQEAAYQHTCNIWSVTRTINGTTKQPGDETYALAYQNVKCLYAQTPNVDDPVPAMGRVKRMTVLTTDVVHFDAAQVIEDNWILKNTTILPDGTHSPSYGDFARVLGAPRNIPNAGRRKGNKRSVMAMSMEKPPNGVI